MKEDKMKNDMMIKMENQNHNNIQTRRYPMFSQKSLLVSAVVAMIGITGCSRHGQITGLGKGTNSTFENQSTVLPYDDSRQSGKLAGPINPQVSFVATVGKINVEGGCWLLKTENDERYEPVFNDKRPELAIGMKLKVTGTPDSSVPTYCMIAPVFKIEKYEILPPDNNGPEVPPMPIITLTGIVHQLDKPCNCIYLSTEADFPVQLDNDLMVIPVKEGAKAKVVGRFNPSKKSECVGGLVFQVRQITYMDDSDHLKKSQANHTPVLESRPTPANAPQPIVDHPDSRLLTLKGIFYSTEAGCQCLRLDKDKVLELNFPKEVFPDIPMGSLVEVKGTYSLLSESRCLFGPVFNVEEFNLIKTPIDKQKNMTLGKAN